jgi:hypothetical protein
MMTFFLVYCRSSIYLIKVSYVCVELKGRMCPVLSTQLHRDFKNGDPYYSLIHSQLPLRFINKKNGCRYHGVRLDATAVPPADGPIKMYGIKRMLAYGENIMDSR